MFDTTSKGSIKPVGKQTLPTLLLDVTVAY
nr:MAG TPA: hypothetical protein [Caudoviricetes sp.]